MTTTNRRTAVHGQPGAPAAPGFRSRATSGSQPGPLLVAERIASLRDLIDDIGEPCWAYGPTASAVHLFDGFHLRPPFHVVIPRGRHVNRIGHVVHTTTHLPPIDRSLRHGIPVTSATRTIIDLAAHEPAERLTLALDSATRDLLTTEDFLHRRIVELRSRGRKGLATLLAVMEGIEITRGGHSWLEREFLRLAAAAGLPRPRTQVVLARRGDRLIRVDCRFDGTPVLVELLGYRFHRSVLQMQADAERMNRLVIAGFVPLQFTYLDVVGAADHVTRTVRDALAPHAVSTRS